MVIALLDELNNCDMAFTFNNDVDVPFVGRLLWHCLAAWNQAGNAEIEPSEFFTADEIRSFADTPYYEIANQTLDVYRIPHVPFDLIYEDEDKIGTPENIDKIDKVFAY